MVIKAAFLVKVLYRGWPVTVCLVQRTCPDSSWKRSQSRKLCSRSEKLHPHHQRLHPGSPHRKSFTNLLTCAIGHSFTHSHIQSISHSLTQLINCSLTHTINELLTHSFAHLLVHSCTHPCTHSCTHLLTSLMCQEMVLASACDFWMRVLFQQSYTHWPTKQ